MKAHVKIDIQIQFEGSGPHDNSKFPLATHLAGVIEVADVDEGARAMTMLQNHVSSVFRNMSVKSVEGGSKPDLAAAMGGDQEPARPAHFPSEPKKTNGELV